MQTWQSIEAIHEETTYWNSEFLGLHVVPFTKAVVRKGKTYIVQYQVSPALNGEEYNALFPQPFFGSPQSNRAEFLKYLVGDVDTTLSNFLIDPTGKVWSIDTVSTYKMVFNENDYIKVATSPSVRAYRAFNYNDYLADYDFYDNFAAISLAGFREQLESRVGDEANHVVNRIVAAQQLMQQFRSQREGN